MKATRLLAAVALAMAALTACGGSDGGTEGSTASTTVEPGGVTADPADDSAENTEAPATTLTDEAQHGPSFRQGTRCSSTPTGLPRSPM